MKLRIRTMVDKHGARNHILFTDESGIANPLVVLDTIAVEEFMEMYYNEQQAVDKRQIQKNS